jgi:hypothetical protein
VGREKEKEICKLLAAAHLDARNYQKSELLSSHGKFLLAEPNFLPLSQEDDEIQLD